MVITAHPREAFTGRNLCQTRLRHIPQLLFLFCLLIYAYVTYIHLLVRQHTCICHSVRGMLRQQLSQIHFFFYHESLED